jgi:hypothetical protein
MKRQHRITSILSTILMAGPFLSQPLPAQQQSSSQPPAQQAPEAAQQPQQQNQPAAAPSNAATPDNAQPPATPAAQEPQAQPQQNPGAGGTSVNPSQGPLQPVQPVTTYPDAAGAQQEQPGTATAPAQTNVPDGPQPPNGPQPKKRQAEPVGAAAAESVPTAGGAAAKPAGVAIAPAKQHQTRSLLFKIGAVAAAGAALGAVFALSHSSPSTPPGAATPGAAPR